MGALTLASPALADGPPLSLPVDCRLHVTCHIQNYVDRDPGPGIADHACGSLSYDGHQGTDFRLIDRAAMRSGVDVLAAAPGRVLRLRDGLPDIAIDDPEAPARDGRDCGNGVVIGHPGGWETQYCHLARGSVTVARGESVARGQPIGRVGLSGVTEFPHLHLTLRDPRGRVIDPFDARPMATPCTGGSGGESLWADPVAYTPGGALDAGLSPGLPDDAELREGIAHRPVLRAGAPAIVAWARFFGVSGGDRIRLRLIDPAGRLRAEDLHEMAKPRAWQLRAVGIRARRPLQAGRWRAEGVLLRAGREIARAVAEADVTPEPGPATGAPAAD